MKTFGYENDLEWQKFRTSKNEMKDRTPPRMLAVLEDVQQAMRDFLFYVTTPIEKMRNDLLRLIPLATLASSSEREAHRHFETNKGI